MKRPDVDFIHGLSPVLAIEQRTGSGGPRSTIATATEIADYAQLLWALCGEQHCPKDGGRVVQRSLDDNVKCISGCTLRNHYLTRRDVYVGGSPRQLVKAAPYFITLLVMGLASQNLRMPKADGMVYRKGSH